jgi:hypothetical protein
MATYTNPSAKAAQDKTRHLQYFRERGRESLVELQRDIGARQFKDLAAAINKAVQESLRHVIASLNAAAKAEKWGQEDTLSAILAATYSASVAMLELRNEAWPYEYMAFSRRIGELWEGFIRTAFDFAPSGLTYFVPPLFSEVRKSLKQEIGEYIEQLALTPAQKGELLEYYEKVWSLVDSGEINLELDLHFEMKGQKINVDLKSGFGSNEKGNTNRLLMVATIYRNLESDYRCVLLVRAPEDQNNHYFRTLRDSSVWEAYCGADAYAQVEVFTGFDLQSWVAKNIDWHADLAPATLKHFKDSNLLSYLAW